MSCLGAQTDVKRLLTYTKNLETSQQLKSMAQLLSVEASQHPIWPGKLPAIEGMAVNALHDSPSLCHQLHTFG